MTRIRVVDHLVHDDTCVGFERKRGAIGEDDSDAGAVAGFKNVALENCIARIELDLRSIRAGRCDLALDLFDGASSLTARCRRRLARVVPA